MPEKQQDKTQNSSRQGGHWWVPLVVGIIMLMVPGGAYAVPIFFLLAIIMKVRSKPKDKNKTSPHSPLP